MRRLELEYRLENMSILYEETTARWHDAEFISNNDFTAHLRIWEDGIEPEQILETLKKLGKRGESFRVALKYLGNRLMVFKKNRWPTYYFDDRTFTPRTEEEINILIDYLRGRRESFCVLSFEMPSLSIEAHMSLSPAPLPRSMPFIPTELYGMAETLSIAEEIVNYPDLMLKLAFLIVEALKGNNNLDAAEQNMKYARDFVSHPICNNPDVVAFVESELPSAKVNNMVQFRRDQENHLSFVSRYAHLTLQRAKEIFEDKVRQDGGFIRD
jgi:hypothetical protein